MRTVLVLIMIVNLLQAKPLGVVGGVALKLPLEMSVETFIARSIGYIPKAIIKDGLPFFGAKRGDFKRKNRLHKGFDIYGNHMDVLASAKGKVIEIAHGKLSGTYIKLQHTGGVQTLYIHLTSVSVKKGAYVKSGEILGRIDGPAGNAVAPQLHYEIKLHGVHQNPLEVLKEAYHDKGLLAQIAEDEMVMQEVVSKRDYLVKAYLKAH